MAYTPDVSMFPYFKSDLNDMKQELQELRQFKKDAEETCASHVVMESLMDKTEQLQTDLDTQKSISEMTWNKWKELHTVLEGFGKRECVECNKWDGRMSSIEVEDMSGLPAHVCYDCWKHVRDDYSTCTACRDEEMGPDGIVPTFFHTDNMFCLGHSAWMCKKCRY